MTHVVKNALCLSNDRNGGCVSTFSSLPVVIDDTNWSGFAVDLVSGSARNMHLQCDSSRLSVRSYFHVSTFVLNDGSLSVQVSVLSERW